MSITGLSRSPLTRGLQHIPQWPQELSSFNERDIKWCYNFFMEQAPHISVYEKENSLSNHFKYSISTGLIININGLNQPFNYNMVIGLKQGNVVDVSWIDRKDGRLLNWLMSCGLYHLTANPASIQIGYCGLASVYPYPFSSPVPAISVEQQYGLIIEYIDSLRFSSTDAIHKQSWLNVLKDFWLKVRTSASDIKWLDQDNEEQLLWAWHYLRDHLRLPPSIPLPVNSKEYYNAILASLDAMTILDAFGQPNAEKQVFIARFKKAWSQKKFRAAGKAKKPYHLPLTVKAKASLEKLALVKGCSESDILEELINREYVAILLDAQGNQKY
ncbi:MAG: hypothetical protein VXW65_04960 [Pseudomonadota bacterium]|nr:hypothetical protein [Pseudomonadota bacterium]